MPQNIYDNPEFFDGYMKLKRQVDGLNGAPEWPTIKTMLPDLTSKRVVDMGCGLGWFARFGQERGAASVLGIDVSQSMIAKAKETTTGDVVKYENADLEEFELPSILL